MTPDKPAISVLVPTFNDGQMLATALHSIRNQTFQDFEVIISDDAGTDANVAGLQESFNDDSRFKFFRQPANLGMTKNWNAALSLATGQKIIKLDGDDALYPETLEHLHDACLRYDAEIAFCRTEYCDEALQAQYEYKGEAWMRHNGLDPTQERSASGLKWYQLCFDDRQLWHSNAFLVAKTLLMALNGWDERWGCASDTDLILRFLETNKTVVHTPYLGVRYRQRNGSVSNRFRSNNWLRKEVAAIHLLSLKRQHDQGIQLDAQLRWNWYRHWVNWYLIEKEHKLKDDNHYPEVLAMHLPAPPLSVRIGGYIRNHLSATRRMCRRVLLDNSS